MSDFSAFVLNLSKSANILFRSMPDDTDTDDTSLPVVGDNSPVHELNDGSC